MAVLPYVTSPGNIEKALKGVQAAATPERVGQDFVKTILQIPGGSGDQMTSYLKKIGFVNADGSPSAIYRRFRNPSSSGKAIAEALRIGYKSLYTRNEFMHQLSDDKLKGLIIEETGQSADANPTSLALSCIKALKKYADFTSQEPDMADPISLPAVAQTQNGQHQHSQQHANGYQPSSLPLPDLGMNLSYTINLNLPATSDIAVFNAIFKSLKDNLLRGGNDQTN